MEIHFPLLEGNFRIDPPLLNSANPWATTLDDLRTLYRHPCTGAVTTRTCLLQGFDHDDSVHQYAFFDPSTQTIRASTKGSKGKGRDIAPGSLNTLGYSPRHLEEYVHDILTLYEETLSGSQDGDSDSDDAKLKPIIISVAGSPQAIRKCWMRLCQFQALVEIPLLMEINLSCPNIAGKPPPAYSAESLKEYLSLLAYAGVPIGLKVPPYTYHDQFQALVNALKATEDVCRISFITAVNTLGSSLVLQEVAGSSPPEYSPAINSSTGLGIGGLAGAPLHPIALGNVKILSGMIRKESLLSHIHVIGVGGVSDADGYRRMKAVGASAVEVGTALGLQGPSVFQGIMNGLDSVCLD